MAISNYYAFPNKVTPSLTNNETINLHSAHNVENYTNLFFVDFLMNVSSAGILNSIHKIEITALFNNLSLSVTNPTYVWTIVYSYAGTNTIHPLFILNLTSIPFTNITTLSVSLVFKVYSTGLLASASYSFSRLLFFSFS